MRCWGLAMALLTAATALPAEAASGEYRFAVTLAQRCPEGNFPITIDTDVGQFSGIVSLHTDSAGNVGGDLFIGSVSVPIRGRFRAIGTTETLQLAGIRGKRRMSIRTSLSSADHSGTARDTGVLSRGLGTVHIDVTSASPLIAQVFAAAHGEPRTDRATASVAICGSHIQLKTGATLGSVDALSLRGAGFKWDSQGTQSQGSYQLMKWKCKSFGSTRSGSTGTIAFSPNGPDIVMLFVSGHGVSITPYLETEGDAGPFLTSSLQAQGFKVAVDYYEDSLGDGAGKGYLSLLTDLDSVNSAWIQGRVFPSRVVFVDHSHGGVWTHAAITARPAVPVAALVDLDANSCDWNVLGHATSEIGGNPVDRYSIGGTDVDLEDLVPESVAFALDVQTDDLCPSILFEQYADPNVRSNGGVAGLYVFQTSDSHSTVHRTNGKSLAVVRDWLLKALTGRL